MSTPTPFQNLNIDPTLLNTLYSINIFRSDLVEWYETGRTLHPLGLFELQKHACLLMYRLFDWCQRSEEREISGRPGSNPIDQSICLAHLIFLVFATEPYAQSFGSRLSKSVVKLRQALQRVSILHWTPLPDLFLWILTMGALGVKDLPQSQQSYASDFAFFVQHAQLSFASKKHHGTTTVDNLLEKVQHYLWISSVFDTRARRVW